MNNNRMPKIMLNYRPNGRWQLGKKFEETRLKQVNHGLTCDG
jgi:hypothetical protein